MLKKLVQQVVLLGWVVLAGCSQLPVHAPVQAMQTGRCPSDVEWTDEAVATAIGQSQETLRKLHTLRGLSNADICVMKQASLERSIYRVDHPKPDHPGEWAKFRALQQSDEDGTVQPDGLIRANATRSAMLQASAANGSVGAGDAGITSGGWTALGPGNIGGRIRSVLTHPSDANKLWIGSVSGGIWFTTNGGSSWSPVNDFLSNLSVSSLVMSPTNSNVMYAGTGEGFYNSDGVRGAGVFKSVDGGVTWSQLASTNPATTSTDWYYVNRLAISPTDGNVLLAATLNGIYRTVDGGASWTKVVSSGFYADVKFDPLDATKALAAPGYSGGYVVYSTNGGSSFANSSLTVAGRVELAYSRTANTVYASADQSLGTVYKSTDGGVNWASTATVQHLSTQGWYDNAIWVDPTNASHVIVAGLDIYRSTDAGLTFTKVSNWSNEQLYGNSVHADHHAIVQASNYDGSTNRTIYFGNDGGIYKAQDITTVTQSTNWTRLNNGLAITQFYSGVGHTGTNGHIIGGTQDNGSLVYSGTGTNWSAFFGGDGGFSSIDPTDGNYFYGEYVYLKIHRSTNGGASASYIYSGISDAGSSSLSNFIAPFTLDPNAPNTMYAGGQSLWRSTNVKAATPTWSTALSSSSTSKISQIHVATGNSNVVWFGRNNGAVYVSTNAAGGTPTWTQVGSGTLPNRMVTSILVDKDNTNVVYVGFGGYGNYLTNSLWKTSDGGTTWTNIGAGLPGSPVRAIQRHPTNANWLYAGTEVGVFTSENGGVTWSTRNDGPANASVEALTWLNSSELLVATHGRGMFKTTVTESAGYTLTVAKTGTGSGTVVSTPAGISCGSTCAKAFVASTAVTLTATPSTGHTFAGWAGACSGTGSCTVSMTQAQSVTATFTAPINTVTVLSQSALSASGSAQTSYTFTVPAGAKSMLVQTTGGTGSVKMYVKAGAAATTSAYDCMSSVSGTTQSCVFTAPQAGTYAVLLVANTTYSGVSLSATYDIVATNALVSVLKSGGGSGTVSSSPAGITCGSDCSEVYGLGAIVTLTATPDAGSVFGGWSGSSCSGTGTCMLSVNSAQTVTANFTPASTGGGAAKLIPILMLLLD